MTRNSLLFIFLFSVIICSKLHSQNQFKLDPRAAKYYSEKDIEKLKLVAPYKIEQINFLYTQSFKIINQDGKPVKTNASTFEIYNYEKFRKDNERVVFRLTREGDALELLSRVELNEAYLKIQNSFGRD